MTLAFASIKMFFQIYCHVVSTFRKSCSSVYRLLLLLLLFEELDHSFLAWPQYVQEGIQIHVFPFALFGNYVYWMYWKCWLTAIAHKVGNWITAALVSSLTTMPHSVVEMDAPLSLYFKFWILTVILFSLRVISKKKIISAIEHYIFEILRLVMLCFLKKYLLLSIKI